MKNERSPLMSDYCRRNATIGNDLVYDKTLLGQATEPFNLDWYNSLVKRDACLQATRLTEKSFNQDECALCAR